MFAPAFQNNTGMYQAASAALLQQMPLMYLPVQNVPVQPQQVFQPQFAYNAVAYDSLVPIVLPSLPNQTFQTVPPMMTQVPQMTQVPTQMFDINTFETTFGATQQFVCTGPVQDYAVSRETSVCEGMSSAPSISNVSSRSSDSYQGCQELFTWSVPSQHTCMTEFHQKYQQGLIDSFRNLVDPQGYSNFTLNLREMPKKKKNAVDFEVSWYVTTSTSEYERMLALTKRKDFTNSLICELAKIDGGSFNRFLDGAKQLTIVQMGYICVKRLQNEITNKNGELEKLLQTPFEDRFDERCMEMLYRVSDDVKGRALRGEHVVGLRFKQQPDILRMDDFLERVLNTIYVERATMIASLKKNKQYKGWSLYLDVCNEASVQALFAICDEFGFTRRPKQCFRAVD